MVSGWCRFIHIPPHTHTQHYTHAISNQNQPHIPSPTHTRTHHPTPAHFPSLTLRYPSFISRKSSNSSTKAGGEEGGWRGLRVGGGGVQGNMDGTEKEARRKRKMQEGKVKKDIYEGNEGTDGNSMRPGLAETQTVYKERVCSQTDSRQQDPSKSSKRDR